ncbi:MAG: hypothetical protein IJB26_04965 [Clostridia bacterium]|nr:hypothetical protein [Clostridia bacterium]
MKRLVAATALLAMLLVVLTGCVGEETSSSPVSESTTVTTTTTTTTSTTTANGEYLTIKLYVKTTYHGYEGYFSKYNEPDELDPTILGLDAECVYVGSTVTEYYDVTDNSNIYFASDSRAISPADLQHKVDHGGGRFSIPVLTTNG